MVGTGDKIIITKGLAIEATGIFAAMFPQLIEKKYGHEFNQKAQRIFYQMSVVEDAMMAVSVGVRKKWNTLSLTPSGIVSIMLLRSISLSKRRGQLCAR